MKKLHLNRTKSNNMELNELREMMTGFSRLFLRKKDERF